VEQQSRSQECAALQVRKVVVVEVSHVEERRFVRAADTVDGIGAAYRRPGAAGLGHVAVVKYLWSVSDNVPHVRRGLYMSSWEPDSRLLVLLALPLDLVVFLYCFPTFASLPPPVSEPMRTGCPVVVHSAHAM
jgi:hypothetical protein